MIKLNIIKINFILKIIWIKIFIKNNNNNLN